MDSNKRLQQENVCQEFSSAAFEQFRCFRDSNELCDVLLCVEEAEFPAHKVVLAASSPYFRAMFTGKMVESTHKKVTLQDLDSDAVEQIIGFFYTGRITIDEDNVQMLLYASCLLQVDRIREFCCDFLAQEICVTNCLGIRALTDSLACQQLFEAAETFAAENFSEVVQCEEFLIQPYESLVGLIELDFLDVRSETELLDGVLKWLRCDSKVRVGYAYPLLKRLHLMRVEIQILENLLTDPVTQSSRDCLELILENIEALSSTTLQAALEFPMFKSRKYRPGKEVLLAIGGESVGMALDSMECFDKETLKWDWACPVGNHNDCLLSRLAQSRMYACVSSTGCHVYTIGGSSSWKPLKSVERYECPGNEWKPVASLNHERLGAGAAVLDCQLLVIGGCGNNGYLSSVESYDPLADEWTVIEPLQIRRCYHGVTALNGYVYVVGGYGGGTGNTDSWLSNVECLIPSGDVSVSTAPMLQHRAYLGLTAHRGSLYAVGGYNLSWLNTVERFDPREGHWYVAPPMKSPRSSLGVSVLGDSLYVAGGFDGVKNLNTVECYDIKAGKWTKASPMRKMRYGMSLTALQM